MLAGALLGALGGAGVARGVNVVRGRTKTTLAWDAAFVEALVVEALLRYLAIAHFGRGRGEWQAGAVPAQWRSETQAAVDARRGELVTLLAARADGEAAIALRLRALLGTLALAVLDALYPDSGRPQRLE